MHFAVFQFQFPFSYYTVDVMWTDINVYENPIVQAVKEHYPWPLNVAEEGKTPKD